jgi:hypothetical protein
MVDSYMLKPSYLSEDFCIYDVLFCCSQIRGEGESARLESLESWKKEVEVKFDTFLSHSKAHAVAMEELRSMFAAFVGKERLLDSGSPCMTESALENQHPKTSKPRKVAGKEKQQSPVSTTGKPSNDDLPLVTDTEVDSFAEAGECAVSEQVPSRADLSAEERIGQGPSEADVADVADLSLELLGSQPVTHAPPTSTNQVDIALAPPAATDLPPSQTPQNVDVVAAEGLVKLPHTSDSGPASGDSNSEDDGPAAHGEINSEASPVEELVPHASPPTAQTKPAEAAQLKPAEAPAAAGSPTQRRSRRPPKSEQQVIFPETLTRI